MVPKLLRARGSLSYRPHLRVGREGEWLGVAFLDGSAEWGEPGTRTECLVASLTRALALTTALSCQVPSLTC